MNFFLQNFSFLHSLTCATLSADAHSALGEAHVEPKSPSVIPSGQKIFSNILCIGLFLAMLMPILKRK